MSFYILMEGSLILQEVMSILQVAGLTTVDWNKYQHWESLLKLANW